MDDYYINQPGDEGNLITPEEAQELRRREKRGIFVIGLIAGACVIGYLLISDIISMPIVLSKTLYKLYHTNPIFQYSVSMLSSVLGLMIPFLSGGAYLRRKTKVKYRLFSKPGDTVLAVYAIPMGFFVCIIGDYVTSVFVEMMSRVGFTLTTPDYATPTSVSGRIVYFFAIAVVPPVVEEIAMRGCIMQPLRKYGDRFAIVMTAFLFAVLHGNLVQAPFAFIAGIAFGYITCITGSLIPSMIIHFLNNTYSVALEFMTDSVTDSKLQQVIYLSSEMIFISVGVIAAVFFIFRLNHRTLRNPVSTLTPAGKAAPFILNPTMIAALLIMVYVTSRYVSYSPVT